MATQSSVQQDDQQVEIFERSPEKKQEHSLKKYVDHDLDTKDVRVDSRLELKEHDADIKYGEKVEKNIESKVEKPKGGLMTKLAGKSSPEMAKSSETVAKWEDVWSDDKKLDAYCQKTERMKKDFESNKKLASLVGFSESDGAQSAGELYDKIADTFVKETGEGRKKEYQFKSFEEFMGYEDEDSMTIWEKIKMYAEGVFTGKIFLYNKVKSDYKNEILMIKRGGEMAKKAAEKGKKGVEKVEEVQATAKGIREETSRLSAIRTERKLKQKRHRPTKSERKINNLAKDFKANQAKNLQNMAKWGPEKYMDRTQNLSKKMTSELAELGPDGAKAVQAGKFPGMNIKGHGKTSVISMGVITMREAIHAENFGDFAATVTKSSFLKSTAETLPIYGTIASGMRLRDHSTGIPLWGRVAEFGLNAVLDTAMIAPIVVGSVFGGAPGAAMVGARMALGAGIRAGIKGVAKGAVKKGVGKGLGKKVSAEGLEAALKNADEIAEQTTKGMTKKAAAQATKGAAQKLAKELMSKMNPTNWRSLWPHMPWTHLGYEGVIMGAEKSWEMFGPKDKTFAEASVDFAIDSQTNVAQKKVIQMTGAREKAHNLVKKAA